MKHTVAALVEDRPGVLNKVASLFRRRGFNIDSLAVGTTEEPGISRMTIVVEGPEGIARQVERQLDKLIDVVTVEDLTALEAVSRELALIKVRGTGEKRVESLRIADVFRAGVVDSTTRSCRGPSPSSSSSQRSSSSSRCSRPTRSVPVRPA